MKPFFQGKDRVLRLRLLAREWIGTPFHPHGRIKGPAGGVSCQTLVAEIYKEAGFLPSTFTAPSGPLDWSRAHKDSQISAFINGEMVNSFEAVDWPAIPGDLLGFRIGSAIQHVGICLWPSFVHCLNRYGTMLSRLDDATYLSRLKTIWRPMED